MYSWLVTEGACSIPAGYKRIPINARVIKPLNGNSGVNISTKARVEPWTSTKTFCFLILSKDEWTFNWASFKFSTPLFSVSCVSHLLVYSHLHSMHSKSFGSFDIIATFGIITLSLLAGEDSNLGAKNFFTTSNTNQKPNPLIEVDARQGQRGRETLPTEPLSQDQARCC